MPSVWQNFKAAGVAAWVITLLAMLALGLVPLALGLAFPERTRRASLYLAVTTMLIAGLTGVVGFVGFLVAHRKVESLIAELVKKRELAWSNTLNIAGEGFWEARASLRVAVFASVFPLIGAAIALVVASFRQVDRTADARRFDRVMIASSSLFALLTFASLAVSGWRDVGHEAYLLVHPLLLDELTVSLAAPRTDDTCTRLDGAIAAMGALDLSREVPTAIDAAKECVEMRFAPIANAAPEVPPAPWPPLPPGVIEGPDAPGHKQRMALIDALQIGLISSPSRVVRSVDWQRYAKLQELRSSHLLVDEAQKQRVIAALDDAEKWVHPPASATPPSSGAVAVGSTPQALSSASSFPSSSASSGGQPPGKFRVELGAVNVSGHLSSDAVMRVLRLQVPRFQVCAESGLPEPPTPKPGVLGRVKIRFVIDSAGNAMMAADGGSDLGVPGVIDCFLRVVRGLSFPQPENGIVVVVSPLLVSTSVTKSSP